MNITKNDWNELMSIVFEIWEGIQKLTNAADKDLISPAEVCRMLKIGRRTYQSYVKQGVFEQIKIGQNKNSRAFVKRSDIERLIEKGRI